MSEKTEQKALVAWFRYQYPKAKIIAIPNAQKFLGKAKNIYSMINSMKAEGFEVGVSDLFIAYPVNGFSGMWLEMKDKGKSDKSLSNEQKAFIKEMNSIGYFARWAAGFDIAKNLIECYMSGLIGVRILK
jgi:hypothetical protein